MKLPLAQPLQIVHDLTAKHLIKQFAHKFELVYFGHVDAREDEYQLVRGLTVAPNHRDTNYAVGHFRGHDITIVERQSALRYPGKPTQTYRWFIMQIDLRHGGLPHVFMDAHHHEEVFYANMFVKFGNLENASRLFMQQDPMFLKYFKTFAPPDLSEEVVETITPDIQAMLAHHFRQFDYEVDDDRLIVYASNTQISLRLLHEMMRVGLWLADQLNAKIPVQLAQR